MGGLGLVRLAVPLAHRHEGANCLRQSQACQVSRNRSTSEVQTQLPVGCSPQEVLLVDAGRLRSLCQRKLAAA